MASLLQQKHASKREWIAVIAAITGAFFSLMDSGISSVNIREVQGALGTSVDEGSWISAAYLIGEMVAVPSAAYLCDVFSPRRYFVATSALFVAFALYSGFSHSLASMLFARFLQGFVGGTFLPLAAYLIVNSMPIASRTLPLLMLGFTTSIAPSVGAMYGGWICVNFDWKLCYIIQAILVAPLILIFFSTIDSRPVKKGVITPIDVTAIALVSLGLGVITYVFQEGNRLDWFQDMWIVKCSIAGVVMLVSGVYVTLKSPKPFIDFRVAWRRNFLACNIGNLLIRVGMVANLYIVTLYLTRIQGYDAFQVGNVVKWYGIPQLIAFPMVLLLLRWFDGRIVIITGTLLFVLMGVMNSVLTHHWGGDEMILSQIIRAFAQPMVLAPITGLAYVGIDAKSVASASAIFNFLRQFATTLGTAILGTYMGSRHTFHYARITESVSAQSAVVQGHLEKFAEAYAARGSEGDREALIKLSKIIDRESYVMSYADAYILISILLLFAIPAIAMARKQMRPQTIHKTNLKTSHNKTGAAPKVSRGPGGATNPSIRIKAS